MGRRFDPRPLLVGGVVVLLVVGGALAADGAAPWWALAPLPVLLLVGGALSTRSRAAATRGRHERHREWARRWGWEHREAEPSLPDRWPGAPFDAATRARGATEVLRGEFRGRPATSFTWWWTTGRGSTAGRYDRHVVVLGTGTPLPRTELVPTAVGTVAGALPAGTVLPSATGGATPLREVRADDPAATARLLGPRVREMLARHPLRGAHLRFEGTDLVAWWTGPTDTDELPARLGALSGLADALVADDPGR